MQKVWSGKGDNKLTYKQGKQNADHHTKPNLQDVPQQILSRYGCIQSEEKFTVLPYKVREYIAYTVDGWVKDNPVTRSCVADSLAGSLTLMAHGTHQIYCSFDRFTDCKFNDGKLLKILRCYKNCVPEPGTYFGEIVAQFFQHCKQQSNLNIKRTTRSDKSDADFPSVDPPDNCVNNVLSLLDATLNMTNDVGMDVGNETNGRQSTTCMGGKKKTDVDGKYEVIMSLKRAATVVLMFRCVQHGKLRSGTNKELIDYLRNKIFGTLVTHTGGNLLDRLTYEFNVKQFENKPNSEVYFSLTLYRNKKNDQILDSLFSSMDLYNDSIRRGIKHRVGVCTLVYCSDTLYFMGMSQTLFIDNSVTFLYCFLTEKYRPVIETKEDSFVFGLVKILASIEYFTECSLKRNCNGKMGHGPLTSVISEGGLNDSLKYVNNAVRSTIVSDPSTEDSLTTAPFTETMEVNDESDGRQTETSNDNSVDIVNQEGCYTTINKTNVNKYYVINEPYINTFLNRPVECGSMY